MKKEIKANHVFEKQIVSREEAIALANSGRLGGLGEQPRQRLEIQDRQSRGISPGGAEEIIALWQRRFPAISAPVRTSCAARAISARSRSRAWPAPITRATKRTRSFSASTARPSRTRPRWKPCFPRCWRRRRSARPPQARQGSCELFLLRRRRRPWPAASGSTAAGTVLIEELEKLAKETEFAAGYERVRTPVLARENMYITSGHLPYYADSMFPPMILDETRRSDGERGAHAPSRAVSGAPAGNTSGVQYSKRSLPHFERPWENIHGHFFYRRMSAVSSS